MSSSAVGGELTYHTLPVCERASERGLGYCRRRCRKRGSGHSGVGWLVDVTYIQPYARMSNIVVRWEIACSCPGSSIERHFSRQSQCDPPWPLAYIRCCCFASPWLFWFSVVGRGMWVRGERWEVRGERWEATQVEVMVGYTRAPVACAMHKGVLLCGQHSMGKATPYDVLYLHGTCHIRQLQPGHRCRTPASFEPDAYSTVAFPYGWDRKLAIQLPLLHLYHALLCAQKRLSDSSRGSHSEPRVCSCETAWMTILVRICLT